jgi:hypothetical protein
MRTKDDLFSKQELEDGKVYYFIWAIFITLAQLAYQYSINGKSIDLISMEFFLLLLAQAWVIICGSWEKRRFGLNLS